MHILDLKQMVYKGSLKDEVFYFNLVNLNGKYITDCTRAGGTLYGLMRISEFLRKDDIVICADTPNAYTFRHRLYKKYKANRNASRSLNVADDYRLIRSILTYIGLDFYEHSDYEADDIMAAAVNKFREEQEIILVTDDSDMNVLISDNVSQIGLSRNAILKTHNDKAQYKRTSLVKAIYGDISDGIPKLYLEERIESLLLSLPEGLALSKTLCTSIVERETFRYKEDLLRNIELAFLSKCESSNISPTKKNNTIILNKINKVISHIKGKESLSTEELEKLKKIYDSNPKGTKI